MKPLRFLRRNPLLLLAAVAVGFVGWVWRDAVPAVLSGGPAPVPDGPPHGRKVPAAIAVQAAFVDAVEGPRAQPDAQALPRLKPGMPRAEVEELMGAPAADRVSAATVADGRVTYLATYEADLAPPPTVRPLAARRSPPAARALVALEYDATKPGHPLVGVHYPDPLF